MVKKLLFILILLSGFGLQSRAQSHDVFARVSVSPREGVIRQPYRVTISVYTATWYTQPLQFTNFKIENAFIIPFTSTLSSMSYIERKPYATLSFYYLVFPYEHGTMEIPALDIVATTPPEGDYKGVPVQLKTRPQHIEIKTLPVTRTGEALWMVAKNIQFSEQWSKPLDELKVGDVLERSIAINAAGTLPSLIQPLDFPEPAGVSLYAGQTELKDLRNAQDVNGRRTEHYSYLFEEEGQVHIPEKTFSWWNPVTRKVYQRTIQGRSLNIRANPDLDLLVSLKDSLDALNMPDLPVAEKEAFPWKKYGIIGVGSLLALFFMFKIVVILIRFFRIRRKTWLESETFFYYHARRSLHKGNTNEFVNNLYRWLDQSRTSGMPAEFGAYLDEENRKLFHSFLNKQLQHPAPLSREDKSNLKHLLSEARKALQC